MRKTIKAGLLTFTACAALAGSALAQPATSDKPADTKTGQAKAADARKGTIDKKSQEVIDAFIEAIGGKKAVLKVRNMHQKIRMDMPAQGLSAEGDVWVDHKLGTKMSLSMAGTLIERGVYKGSPWASDPFAGPRLLEDAEAEEAIRSGDLLSWTHPEKYYKTITYAGEETVDGVKAHKLEFVTWDDQPSTTWYDAESGLLIRTSSTEQSPYGPIESVSTISDYKPFGDVKWPTKTSVSASGQTMAIVVEKVDYDAVTEGDVAPPEAIKTLLQNAENSKAD